MSTSVGSFVAGVGTSEESERTSEGRPARDCIQASMVAGEGERIFSIFEIQQYCHVMDFGVES
jgi:hypothetical protein